MSSEDEKDKRKGKSIFLSEEEKKAHHIASEQKRREQIRSEFDHLVNLVPSLSKYENRSELSILTKSADYIDQLRQENERLIRELKSKNIDIPEDLIFKELA